MNPKEIIGTYWTYEERIYLLVQDVLKSGPDHYIKFIDTRGYHFSLLNFNSLDKVKFRRVTDPKEEGLIALMFL